jgi:hypothetical protein
MRLVVVNSHRGGREFDSEDAIESEAQLQEVKSELAVHGVDHDVRQLVRGMDPAEDLVNVATEVDAESHRDRPAPSLARRQADPGQQRPAVLLDAPCPVLAVKAGEA